MSHRVAVRGHLAPKVRSRARIPRRVVIFRQFARPKAWRGLGFDSAVHAISAQSCMAKHNLYTLVKFLIRRHLLLIVFSGMLDLQQTCRLRLALER